jgi:hypothetical protein
MGRITHQDTAFIGPTDARWSSILERLAHDAYHLPAYVTVCAREAQGEALAFWARHNGSELLIPLIARPILGSSARDLTSAYGYSSPLFIAGDESSASSDLRTMLEMFVSRCRHEGFVSAFLRLHPFFALPSEPFADIGQLVYHGPTVFLDLRQSEEDLFRQMRKMHRTDIHSLQRDGFVAEIDRLELLEEAAHLYNAAMERLNASPWYRFEYRYFHELARIMQGIFHLGTLRSSDGATAACSFIFECNGIVQAHLAATSTQFLTLSPSKLLFYELALWAKRRGNEVLHLGGGRGGRKDSLFFFKEGFSKRTAPFHSWRVICDTDEYTRLSEGAQGERDEAFFPAYRRNEQLGQPGGA